MITINLLPKEMRKIERSAQFTPAHKALIAAGVAFLLLSGFFYFDFWVTRFQLNSLKKKYKAMEPANVELTKLKDNVEKTLMPEKEFLEKMLLNARPVTPVLGWVNEFLPDNAWITEFRIDRERKNDQFLLKGLALPIDEQPSIELLEGYINRLKEKMPDAQLSLMTTRQLVDNVTLTQFSADFSWEEK
ncbi:MAG: hypothetical protein A2Z83_09455 [Omnitrophica bacterium GWA2_52_8]|nr:MAG: hypothetical protein A2Z83_09455 [Omnitrophica bacterium GWA2_52_8]